MNHFSKLTTVLKKEAGIHEPYACGPASLKTWLSFFDVSVPPLEVWMGDLLKRGIVGEEKGFIWKEAVRYLKELGLEASFSMNVDLKSLEDSLKTSPVLISVKGENGGHVVVLSGRDEGGWSYYDPESGELIELKEDAFNGKVLKLKENTP